MPRKWCLVSLLVLTLPLAASGLTLDQALQKALRDNPALAVHRSRLTEAELRIATARTSYRPQLGLSGAYTYQSRVSEIQIHLPLPVESPKISTGTHHALDSRLAANYTLLDFGRRAKMVEQAGLGKAIAANSLQSARQDVAYAVVKAYAASALALAQSRLAQEFIDVALRHVADARVNYENGLVSQFDLLKSEVQLKIYEQQKAVADAEFQIAISRLDEVIGASPENVLSIEQPLNNIRPQVATDDSAAVFLQFEAKPEIVGLRRQQEVSRLTESIDRLRPTLSLNSAAGWRNAYMPDPDRPLFNYSAGVAISYPLFDGGGSRARRAEERERRRTIDLEIERLRAQVFTATRVLRGELLKIDARRRMTEERLVLARKALDIAGVAYATGTITNTEYLQTELDLQKTEIELLNDQFALIVAQLELKRALGFWPEIS